MTATAKAVAGAFRTLRRVAGVEVTYFRGTGSVCLLAIPSRIALQANGERPTRQFTTQDFLIRAADLMIASASIMPKSGDQIQRMICQTRVTYEVETPPYTPADTDGQELRVHAKIIRTEAP